MPSATPMAKISGRAPKIGSPEARMISRVMRTNGAKQNNWDLAPLRTAPPTPSRMPATGNTATGSMSDLPSFCMKPKTLLPRLSRCGVCGLVGSWAVTVAISGSFGERRGKGGSGAVRCRGVVVERHERADLGSGVQFERGSCQVLAGDEREKTDLRLDAGNRRNAHAELVNTEADQQRDGLRVGRHTATDSDPATGGVCRGHALGDQPEHRGVEPVHLRSQLRVPTIHRQGVLGEVVGPDREEVHLCRE